MDFSPILNGECRILILTYMVIHPNPNLSLIWSFWKEHLNSRDWNNTKQSEQAAGPPWGSGLEWRLRDLLSHCFPYISPIRFYISATSLVFRPLWLKREGRGQQPTKQRLQCLQSWENPSFVRADAIYSPVSVHALECTSTQSLQPSSGFWASVMRKKRKSGKPGDEGGGSLF